MKYIIITALILMTFNPIYSQTCCTQSNCYIRLDDISGFDTGPYQAELQDSACSLVRAFPAAYQSQFKVFDFGFYRHSEHFEGEFPEEFDMAIAQAEQASPYYLLFGKQCDSKGIYTRIWVKVKLPDDRAFSCMDEAQLEGLASELTMLANYDMINYTEYFRKECDAIHRLREFVIQETNCCEMGEMIGGRDSDIEFKIDIFEKGVVDAGEKEKKYFINSVPKMPEILFKVKAISKIANGNYSYDQLVCTQPLKLKLTFEYSRGNRNDIRTLVFQNLKANNTYYIKWHEENLEWKWTNEIRIYGLRKFIRGGKITGEVYFQNDNTFSNKLCSIPFSILGENPTIRDVYEECDKSFFSRYWFLKKILAKESFHGISDPYAFAQQFEISKDKGLPNSNNTFDGGWGLSQITSPKPDTQMLWDWKYNLWGARLILDDKVNIIVNKLQDDIDAINKWNIAPYHEFDQVEKLEINYGGYKLKAGPSYALSSSENSSNTKFTKIIEYFNTKLEKEEISLLDAAIIKAYNCTSGCDTFIYHELDSFGKPVWKYTDINEYVKKVLEEKIPKY
ncbi:MAG: hypothetical protein R2771_16455 [Saprospiraceae bacterium]